MQIDCPAPLLHSSLLSNCGWPQRKPVELNLFSLSPPPSPFLSLSLRLCLCLCVALPSWSLSFSFTPFLFFLSYCWVTFSVSVFPSLSLAVFCLRADLLDWWMRGWTDRRRAGSSQRVKNTLGLNINQATRSHITLYKQQNKSLCALQLSLSPDRRHSQLITSVIHANRSSISWFIYRDGLLFSRSCFHTVPDVRLNYRWRKSGLMYCTPEVTSKLLDKEVSM